VANEQKNCQLWRCLSSLGRYVPNWTCRLSSITKQSVCSSSLPIAFIVARTKEIWCDVRRRAVHWHSANVSAAISFAEPIGGTCSPTGSLWLKSGLQPFFFSKMKASKLRSTAGAHYGSVQHPIASSNYLRLMMKCAKSIATHVTFRLESCNVKFNFNSLQSMDVSRLAYSVE